MHPRITAPPFSCSRPAWIAFATRAFAVACAPFALLACGSDASPTSGPDGVSQGGSSQPDTNLDANRDASRALLGSRASRVNCVNLECRQATCSAGASTTVRGRVFDPGGRTPIYNAVVYVPNADVAPFEPRVRCDACGAAASGSPLVATLTGADGAFTLSNVPVGDAIPIVVQVGKWRRQVRLPRVEPCVENRFDDPGAFRLPRNKREGDIPQMAIATAIADPFECLLRKVGIDDSEFTSPAADGRVHVYVENGVVLPRLSDFAPARDLYSNRDRLASYDMVFLPCEGAERAKSTTARENLVAYAEEGGRVFATHYSYQWIRFGAGAFPRVADWQATTAVASQIGYVDTSFPKGRAMAEWLENVGASPSFGALPIADAGRDIVHEDPSIAQRWVTSGGPSSAQRSSIYFTFNTPIGNTLPCGRVVFSDFHVSLGARTLLPTFPASCRDGALTPQEAALEFMMFDLASCVANDRTPPSPPPTLR